MLNSDIANKLPKDVPVYADSAEPKSIRTLQLAGITIKGVTKGRDSINYGIDVMQREEYLVTSNSTRIFCCVYFCCRVKCTCCILLTEYYSL